MKIFELTINKIQTANNFFKRKGRIRILISNKCNIKELNKAWKKAYYHFK